MDVGNLAYTYGFIWDLIYYAVTPAAAYYAVTPAAALDAVTPAAACTYVYTMLEPCKCVISLLQPLWFNKSFHFKKQNKKAYVCNIQSLKKLLLVSKELVNNGFSFWRTKEVNGSSTALCFSLNKIT